MGEGEREREREEEATYSLDVKFRVQKKEKNTTIDKKQRKRSPYEVCEYSGGCVSHSSSGFIIFPQVPPIISRKGDEDADHPVNRMLT